MIVMISTKLEEYTISIWETLTCPHSKEYSHMPGLGVIEGGGSYPPNTLWPYHCGQRQYSVRVSPINAIPDHFISLVCSTAIGAYY